MKDKVLEIEDLTKEYVKGTPAVDQLSFHVERGAVFGVLGPNGSGKTTTLGMILGVIKPSSGTYQWFGDMTDHEARKRIGALLETPNFYPNMTAHQNLEIVAEIKKVDSEKLDDLIQLVGLGDYPNFPFKSYSLGMKQRLGIASALVGDPDVLILDEPTNGLDPKGIVEVRELILEIARKGKTILLASHIIDEVEKVCDQVAIIKKGVLLAIGSVSELLGNETILRISCDDIDHLHDQLSKTDLSTSIDKDGESLKIRLKANVTAAMINKWAFEKGIVLSRLEYKNRSLEEEFLAITSSDAAK